MALKLFDKKAVLQVYHGRELVSFTPEIAESTYCLEQGTRLVFVTRTFHASQHQVAKKKTNSVTTGPAM